MAGPPLKILWLTKGLGPGGAERLLVSLARSLDQTRFSFTVAYLIPTKDHLVAEIEAAGVHTVCLDGARALDVRWAGRLKRMVHDYGFDIVHVHSPYPAALARPVLRLLGRRRPAVVYTEHNSWDGYGLATRWANAVTYPLDDARLAVSATALSSIPRRLRGKTEVLVHGTELDAVTSHRGARERVRGELGVGAGEVLVVTVANLRVHKDYPTLLRAARKVIDSGAPVRFVAVGQGPLESEIRAEIDRLALGQSFQLLGYRQDALDILAAGDIFALSSLAEGYPVAVMEALALGLPVVSTEVGGIPEAVRSGVEGLLVPPASPDLLADALVELATDGGRRAQMSAAASERSSLFDIRRAAARLAEVYTEVIEAQLR